MMGAAAAERPNLARMEYVVLAWSPTDTKFALSATRGLALELSADIQDEGVWDVVSVHMLSAIIAFFPRPLPEDEGE